MSAEFDKRVEEGFVAQRAVDARWLPGWFVYPNWGPFYNSAKRARREVGPDGKVYRVTVTYEEVED